MHRRYALLVIVFANLDKILKLGFWEYLREISRGKLCFFQILSKERFCIKIKPLLFEIISIIQCVSANHWRKA